MHPDPEARLRRLYAAYAPALLAYALRRGATREDAADLVSDVFLAAWRRIDDVPAGDEARLWLYGTARRLLANQRRGARRRDRLGAALREHARTLPEPEPVDPELAAALAALREIDRNLLALIAWEGLTVAEAAHVLGLRAGTARARVHRARARLRAALPATTGALR